MKGFSKTRIPNLRRNDSSGIFYAFTRVGKGKSEIARSLGTNVETIAKLKLPRVLAQIRATAGRLTGANLTLGECSAVFMENKRILGHKRKLLKPRSLDYRTETIDALRRLWPKFDAARAALVTRDECIAWAKRARAKYSATRFNGMLQSLRGILEVAVEAGALEKNFAMKLETATLPKADKLIPTREQFTAILSELDKLKSRKHAALSIRALAFTGLRPNEGRNLEAADIDLNQRTLTARVTKNGDPRTIELIDQAVELFESDLTGVLKALKKNPRKALATVCTDLNLAHLTPYFTRHMNLTRLLECGVDIIAATQTAGHRDQGRTLLKHYIKKRQPHVREQMKKVFI